MKASEAPEKIILSADRDTQIINDEWVINDYTDNIKIEYTRTDAFIEKACEWLKDNITYIHPRKGTKECIVNLTRFRDFMKGE